MALGYAPFPLAPASFWATFVPILHHAKRSRTGAKTLLSGTGDRQVIVVGAGLCDGEDERAYTVCDLILGAERLVWCS